MSPAHDLMREAGQLAVAVATAERADDLDAVRLLLRNVPADMLRLTIWGLLAQLGHAYRVLDEIDPGTSARYLQAVGAEAAK